jgi:beta-N-acetylhexosaminidase
MERLHAVEFPPFQAAIRAGVKLTMTAHVALPALDGPDAPPATLSRNILTRLLRKQLGFEGVIVTDAMDMHAISQGELLGESAVKAFNAGADLLLLTTDPDDQQRVYRALIQAAENELLDFDEVNSSAERVLALKDWLAKRPVFDLSVVGCSQHQKVADEIAESSITLVRDEAHLIPLRLESNQRMAVVIPKPQDLTPADTSSYIVPELAKSLRAYHPNVDEFVIPHTPEENEISSLVLQLKNYDLVVAGTINAYTQSSQQILVREILKTGIPTIVVALRLPYDLAAFPEAPTYLCTYSILEPSMRAVAKGIFGQGEIKGHLPVTIPSLYRAEHQLHK